MTNLRKRFEIVQGYHELGMAAEALAELADIEREVGPSTGTLALRMVLHRAGGQWTEMREVADMLNRRQPTQPETWIWLADATRHSVSLEAARDILMEAEKTFPANAHIKFQIGCYHCRLGAIDPAEAYVRAAIALDQRWGRIALADEDVRELWSRLEAKHGKD